MTCRLLLVAYAGLAGILPAGGRPWLAVPLCLAVLLATGGLWLRALCGVPADPGLPATRAGLAATAGLMTFPLVAILLHAAGQPVRPAPLVVGCAVVVTVLGAGALLRDRFTAPGTPCLPGLPAQRRHTAAGPTARPASGDPAEEQQPVPASGERSTTITDVPPAPPLGYARTTAAVTIPVVLAVGVGGLAVRGYLTGPHPAEPGYLSVALSGWAAAVDSPVTVPAQGLEVPVLVSSAGLGSTTTLLRLRVGGQVVASRPMTVAADSVRSLTVHLPALPADGCLRAVDISLGSTSAGFYARGLPGPAARAGAAGTARTAPGGAPARGRVTC
jgi:hypothetical protein